MLAATQAMCVKPTGTFLPGLINILKMIKIVTFMGTSLKTLNANQLVMGTRFQFYIQQELNILSN